MIKLKVTSRDMKLLVRYLQICIEISRYEVANGLDIVINKMGDSSYVKHAFWSNEDRGQRALNVSARTAHNDEFEKLQKKLLISFDRRNESKIKTIGITPSCGHFFLLYLPKVEHGASLVPVDTKGLDQVIIVAATQANAILKKLI